MRIDKASRYFPEHDFLSWQSENQLQYSSSFHGILDLRQYLRQPDYQNIIDKCVISPNISSWNNCLGHINLTGHIHSPIFYLHTWPDYNFCSFCSKETRSALTNIQKPKVDLPSVGKPAQSSLEYPTTWVYPLPLNERQSYHTMSHCIMMFLKWRVKELTYYNCMSNEIPE